MVITSEEMNMLEVLFDTVGTKKIMYKFSKLTKIS